MRSRYTRQAPRQPTWARTWGAKGFAGMPTMLPCAIGDSCTTKVTPSSVSRFLRCQHDNAEADAGAVEGGNEGCGVSPHDEHVVGRGLNRFARNVCHDLAVEVGGLVGG